MIGLAFCVVLLGAAVAAAEPAATSQAAATATPATKEPAAAGKSGEKSDRRPGINDPFRDPQVPEWTAKFETESREVFAHRKEIVKECNVRPGEAVADIGAGTGLFTHLFAAAVGERGRVYAVDISQKFIAHIEQQARERGAKHVVGVVCKQKSVELPAASIDLAFVCDTYHHFEFPENTLASIHAALKPGGRLVVVDFRRIEGESTPWVLGHVRAGQEVFAKEITAAGFRQTFESKLLKENYLLVFEKVAATARKAASHRPAPQSVAPIAQMAAPKTAAPKTAENSAVKPQPVSYQPAAKVAPDDPRDNDDDRRPLLGALARGRAEGQRGSVGRALRDTVTRTVTRLRPGG